MFLLKKFCFILNIFWNNSRNNIYFFRTQLIGFHTQLIGFRTQLIGFRTQLIGFRTELNGFRTDHISQLFRKLFLTYL